jgi:hypothetical protein
MNQRKEVPVNQARFAVVLIAFAAAILAQPLPAQIQPQKPAPSLTPQQNAPPASPPANSTPPAQAPSTPPAPPATPATLAKGKSIVLAAAKAAGGDSLKNVKSVEVHVSGQAVTQSGPMDLSLKIVVSYPDHFRSEAELPVGTFTQGFDGSRAWVSSPQGVIDLPEDFNGEVARGIALTGAWGLYQQALDGKLTAQYIDDEDFDGKKANVVQWTAANGPVKLYFDPATHLLIGAHFRAITPQGDVQSNQHWSDFRSVEGIQFPFHNVVDHDGEKFTETTVSEVKINTNPDPTIFSRPPDTKPPSE